MDDKDPKYINSLLDVDQYTGFPHKRMGPIITYLLIAGIPLLLWVYFLMPIVPFTVAAFVEILWALRWALIIPGEESRRLAEYMANEDSAYHSEEELLGIKNIHEDGLIEYLNGEIGYVLIAENGNQGNKVARAQRIRAILDRLDHDYVLDVYALNDSIGSALRSRYSKIKVFQDKSVMFDFVNFIDYVIDTADSMSYLYTTYFVVRARRSSMKTFRSNLEILVSGAGTKTFRVLRILNSEEVRLVNSQELGIYVDYEAITMSKYFSGDYHGSHVVDYDAINLDPAPFEKGRSNIEEVGFINESED